MDSDRLLVGQGDPFLEMGADSALEWLIELILDWREPLLREQLTEFLEDG